MRRIGTILRSIVRAAPFADSDRRRRAESLNILLLGTFVAALLALVSTLAMSAGGGFPADVTGPLIMSLAGFLIVITLLYLLNRRTPEYASIIFTGMLVLVVLVGGTPEDIAHGPSQLELSLPIIVAAVILPPWTTFAFALVSQLVVTVVAARIGAPFTPFSALTYLIFALVSYLGAHRLESALKELRLINEELDHRVAERTHELMEANRQLAGVNDRLREVDQLKSRFLSMVSHELRTPLSAIQGFAEILSAEIYGPVTPAQRNAIQRITSNVARLLSLVGDLLDRARIEAGQLNLHMHPFSPAELAEDVQSTLDVLAQSKGLTLTTVVAPDLPPEIIGDEARLRQILVNLVNNALKFTERGGVAIQLYRAEGNGASRDPAWMLSVSDSGPGISVENQAFIFEPFRRVDDSATRKEMGVGLGLSIVKDLVELMKGTVTLKSDLGEGSTFTIVLPLLVEEESTGA